MNKTLLCLTVLFFASVVALRSIGIAAPLAEQKHVAFLDRLNAGQAVSLTDQDGRYEIGVFPKGIQPLGYTVIEVAQDYVVLRDIAKVTDTIIPIYSIKSIRVLRAQSK